MIFVILVCLPVHEVAHGLVALAFGDPTAKNAGRLTLNPMAHLDPIGAIAFLLLGIGWAKPVPVNYGNLKSKHLGPFLISFAGPFSNLVMALVLLVVSFFAASKPDLSYFMLFAGLQNIWLAVFNLIPILPFDGGNLVLALLPRRTAAKIDRFMSSYQAVVTVALLVLWKLGILMAPLTIVFDFVSDKFLVLAGHLAGAF